MNELQSLNDLFKNNIFRIPNYQRGYSWEEEQLSEFWEDICNLPENKEHYTGMLSLKELDKEDDKEELKKWNDEQWLLEKDYRAYHVVDGQQRLTTLIILMQAIVDIYRKYNEDKSDEEIILNGNTRLSELLNQFIYTNKPGSEKIISTYLFGYEVDKPSDDYLKNRILNPNYDGEITESFYTVNLDYAKDFFINHLEELSNNIEEKFKKIDEIFKKITNKLKFNIYFISKNFNVNVAFETMNNRGKRLSNLELLKNRLIYLTSLLSLPIDEENKLMSNINETWRNIYYNLGKSKDKTLPDDEFLLAHSYVYFGYISDLRKGYSQFLLKKYFNQSRVFNGLKEIKIEHNEIEEDEDPVLLENQEENYEELSTKINKKDINDYIKSLDLLVPYWYNVHFGINNPDNKETIKMINETISRFNNLDYNYFKPLILVILSKKKIDYEKKLKLLNCIERFIFIVFRLCGYQATYRRDLVYKYTHELYLDEIDIDEVIEGLENIDILSANKVLSSNSYTTMLARLFKRDGFYSWKANRYFLYEYESKLLKELNGTVKISKDYFTPSKNTDKVSIEHIFPQSESSEYWLNIFNKYTLEQRNKLRGTLGNLLPLSLEINRKLQDDNIDIKSKRYEKGSYSEQEVASSVKDSLWTAEKILERGMKLIDFMEKRWDFKLENDKERKKILGLDFMVEKDDENKNVTVPINTESSERKNKEIIINSLDDEFYLTMNGEKYATGIYQDSGILVKKGSKIRTEIIATNKSMIKKVEKLRKTDKIRNNVYIEDVFYITPSEAANAILGNNKNGWTNWKNALGKSLDEIARK